MTYILSIPACRRYVQLWTDVNLVIIITRWICKSSRTQIAEVWSFMIWVGNVTQILCKYLMCLSTETKSVPKMSTSCISSDFNRSQTFYICSIDIYCFSTFMIEAKMRFGSLIVHGKLYIFSCYNYGSTDWVRLTFYIHD